MAKPLITPLWQSPDLQDLQRQLELLLLFCDDDQLAGGGLSRTAAERLLTTPGAWSDIDLLAVLAATSAELPC